MWMETIQKLQLETSKDEALQLLKRLRLAGGSVQTPSSAEPLLRYELGVYDRLVFKGERLVVTQGLRAEIRMEIHLSHAGVEGCLCRSMESAYWPGMNIWSWRIWSACVQRWTSRGDSSSESWNNEGCTCLTCWCRRMFMAVKGEHLLAWYECWTQTLDLNLWSMQTVWSVTWQGGTYEPWGTTGTLTKSCCWSVHPRSDRLSCYGRLL